MENIKPCPFCGSTNLNSIHISLNKWSVLCNNCLAEGPLIDSQEKAIEIWNKRIIKFD